MSDFLKVVVRVLISRRLEKSGFDGSDVVALDVFVWSRCRGNARSAAALGLSCEERDSCDASTFLSPPAPWVATGGLLRGRALGAGVPNIAVRNAFTANSAAGSSSGRVSSDLQSVAMSAFESSCTYPLRVSAGVELPLQFVVLRIGSLRARWRLRTSA